MARLVCDPAQGITSYRIEGLPGGAVEVPAQADGSLSYDVSNISAGDYPLSVYAEEGGFMSKAAPFALDVPNIAAPVNLRIV